jgi:probable rRNA maturation factor
MKPSDPDGDPSFKRPRTVRYAIDVAFIGDDEIAALNRDYRHKNKPTDVLSFSLWEGEEAPPPDEFQDEMPLGDLVISLETAARQAAELGHSLVREVEFLAVHGTLHLLGYDHIRAHDRRVMWKWQEEIVKKVKS